MVTAVRLRNVRHHLYSSTVSWSEISCFIGFGETLHLSKTINSMSGQATPTEVLVMGSLPLSSASETFRTLLRVLPGRLRRIPDGETVDRANFIGWQLSAFPLPVVQPRWGGTYSPESKFVDYSLSDLNPTGYDDRALASYATFCELRAAGEIPHGLRFQVSLPTPLAVVRGFVESKYCPHIEPLYEKRLLEALNRIQSGIPASDLSIQWDLPFEIACLEHDKGRLQDPYMKPYFSPVKSGIMERLKRLATAVGADVELGYHLCYGDMGHVHFVQPDDMGLLVEMANAIVEDIGPLHPVSYLHMPVPKDRTDEAFFTPLKGLKFHGTQLFLGLVHPGDENGTQQRVDAAHAAYSGAFGIASECGLGRTPPEQLEGILEICASITDNKAQAKGEIM